MMCRALLVIFLLAFMTSCSGFMFANEEGYRDYLSTFNGKPISEFTKINGQADGISESAAGNKVFVFKESDFSSTSGYCSTDKKGNTSCTSGSTSVSSCTTYIEVNKDNIIVGSSFKGNNCHRCPPVTVKSCFGRK